MAGFVHDIGKRRVPETLLNRTARADDLTSPERDLLRSHAAEGEKTLAELGLPVSPSLLEAVRQHHERFDGTGFPDRLAGTSICLGARVIALAETYEALTGWRPYREPSSREQALEFVREGAASGTYDPKIAEVFLEMMAG